MRSSKEKIDQIRAFIVGNIVGNPGNIVKLASEKFNISRQAINKHVKHLVQKGDLAMSGTTRSRTYSLKVLMEKSIHLQIDETLKEDIVWRERIVGLLGTLPENVMSIWNYGVTEIINNAIDHSGGNSLIIDFKKNAVSIEISIWDDGEGIFKKIQRELSLYDERHAVLELSKGKLTTDPERHTGEGIFFSSRMFDYFSIISGKVYFSHKITEDEDWILENTKHLGATGVTMTLNNNTQRTVKEIFDTFSSEDDDYRFNKTVVPVRLAQYEKEHLISRSQAKRLLARIDRFKTVIFDFTGVEMIGQAFADEIFRVFALQHPNMEICPINTNHEVDKIIRRAKPSS